MRFGFLSKVYFWASLVLSTSIGMELHAQTSSPAPAHLQRFIQAQCMDCHDTDTKKGGLDLSVLSFELKNPETLAQWVKVYDRVAQGEMPPKARKIRPSPSEVSGFTQALEKSLTQADREAVAQQGRSTQRRLNRYEYEETLRDLFSLPSLEVKAFLPEDREAYGYNKVGDALDVSHVQMSRFLSAAEFALNQALAPQSERPHVTTRRFYSWDEGEFSGRIRLEGPLNRRTFPILGWDLQTQWMSNNGVRPTLTNTPAAREKESMAVVVSTYEPTEIRFGGFRAPMSAKYRIRFSAYSIWMAADFKSVKVSPRSEPVCLYAETPPRSLRKVGGFDAHPQPTEYTTEVWLLAGETIRPDAARLFRSRPPDHKNPLAGPDGMPGVAFQWMEVEGPLFDTWPPAGHQLMFGNLPTTNRVASAEPQKNPKRFKPLPGIQVVSSNAAPEATELMRQFLTKAYRRKVEDADVTRFVKIVQQAMSSGSSFTEAMITGYTAALCSPAFLYLREEPGPLDDNALAERLSYFLWNSAPDETLRSLARNHSLHRASILREQTERLLKDPRSDRFIGAFLDYWLDLRMISGTAPDEELYPDYQLDDLLTESMIEETQSFFRELLNQNLKVTHLVGSDFAMLNERLATLYGIPGVEGIGIRRVKLPPGSVRGGLMTQASVLKVTSNGTTTSPVKRGAWIMSRVLGKPPPPPPPSVPAVEPDIRGATTIREQLAKHRTLESCNACHRQIDPAGFALESFDVMGAWRDRYRAVGQQHPVEGVGHNGNRYHFSLGPSVDPTGELPDGRSFKDVRDLKQCVMQDPEVLARNLVQQWTVYATGAPIRFSDRAAITKILDASKSSGYGVRSLLHAFVQSELFRNK